MATVTARMPMDFLFDMAFVTKLVLTATIVVTASMVTERAGPLIGAVCSENLNSDVVVMKSAQDCM
jgi:hypothetical protein